MPGVHVGDARPARGLREAPGRARRRYPRGEGIVLRGLPQLLSNSVAPSIVAAGIAVMDRLSTTTELRDRLEKNTAWFRKAMTDAGFDIKPGVHPIVPIMLGDAKLAGDMARDLLAEGIYVIGFSYPVVPKGEARIRVQISAGHTQEHLEKAVGAFVKVGAKYGAVSA